MRPAPRIVLGSATSVPAKRVWERSAFLPLVGTTMCLLASALRGGMEWLDFAATVLMAWGTFLGGTARRPSASAGAILDAEEEAADEGKPGCAECHGGKPPPPWLDGVRER